MTAVFNYQHLVNSHSLRPQVYTADTQIYGACLLAAVAQLLMQMCAWTDEVMFLLPPKV